VRSLELTTDDGNVLLDYSKNLISEEVLEMLFDMVQFTVFITFNSITLFTLHFTQS